VTAARLWLVAALLAGSLAGVARADEITPDHIRPFVVSEDRRQPRLPLIDVLINGQPARLLVDTGASIHLLSETIADKAQLRAGGLATLSDHFGDGSKEDALRGAVITAGDWTLSSDKPVLAKRLPEGFPADGLLSPQSISTSGEALVLDLVHGQLSALPWLEAEAKWGDFGTSLADDVVVCEGNGSPIGFLLPVEIAGQKVNLLLDTGANRSNLVLGKSLAEKLKADARPAGQSTSISKSVDTSVLPPVPLAIGKYHTTVGLVLVPNRETFECRRDGVLGLDVLDNCVIAMAGRKLLVQCQDPPPPSRTSPAAGPVRKVKPIKLVAKQDSPHGIAIDSKFVYWTNLRGGQVLKVARAGGTPVVLASGLDHPFGIAASPDAVYVTTEAMQGKIVKIPLDGTKPAILASGRRLPQQIAADSRAVYWTEGGNHGRVMRLPLAGGSPIALASDQDHPCRLAVEGENVYWRNEYDDPVMTVAIAGGKPRALAPAERFPLGVADELQLEGASHEHLRVPLPRKLMAATDGTALFWTDPSGGTILSVSPP